MAPEIQEEVVGIKSRIERRINEGREDLARRVEEQRLSREKEYQKIVRDLDFYMGHLAGIYQRIVKEGDPFTMGTILDAYTPEAVLGLVHDSIFYLKGELADEQSGNLEISNRFRVGDLDKLRDLRRNTEGDLIKLLKGRDAVYFDRIADDIEVYGAVALGFVEVSPEDLSNTRANVSKANSFLIAYKNSPFLRRLKLSREASEKREFVNPERQVELDYVLTSLGRAAVLPIDRKYIGLAEQERVFEED